MHALLRRPTILLCLALLATGCISHKKSRQAMEMAPMEDHVVVGYDASGSPLYANESAGDAVGENRLMVWTGDLTLETADVANAADRAIAIAHRSGGYLESRSDSTYSGTTLKLRIPAQAFTNAIGALETLGDVAGRRLSSEDVTEPYVDVEARLKNKLVLRDRLRQLLDQATEVKDILAIETELNRVQGDVDSMEARLKSLKGRVDYAALHLHLRPKELKPRKILGPLGYLFKGLFWTVEKLFVIRE
ncbi:MAG: DUF4349 domain-containing protein [Spartobacteria bacterium]|nr:DUF4349 domain-containing protein [Spartobacteria bacterium]